MENTAKKSKRGAIKLQPGNPDPDVTENAQTRPLKIQLPSPQLVPAVAPPGQHPAFSVVSEDSDTLVFDITGAHYKVVNAIRRAIYETVETIVIHGFSLDPANILAGAAVPDTGVVVSANDSVVINEELGRRLSLIPVFVADPTIFNVDKYDLRIEVENKNSTEGRHVTAADIEIRERGAVGAPWRPAKDFFRPNPITGDYVLITYLRPAARPGASAHPPPPPRLSLTAQFIRGNGMMNAAFIPAHATYEFLPETGETEAGQQRLQSAFDEWIVASKKQSLLETAEGRDAARREFDSMERFRVWQRTPEGEPAVLRFTVETFGPMAPRAIVTRALESLLARVTALQNIGTAAAAPGVTITPSTTGIDGVDIEVQGETYTLEELVQYYLARDYVKIPGEPEGDRTLTFAGGFMPHPLKQAIVWRISPPGDVAIRAFTLCIKDLIDLFQGMLQDWAAI